MSQRVRPSVESRRFAELRAVEMAAGVTPQRRKELHQKMRRLRRKDYMQWRINCIDQLNQCVKEGRWRDVKKWKNALRGVYRQGRTLPSRGHKNDIIRFDEEAAHYFREYLLDLYARTLSDRARYGDSWPDVEGDPNGPGSEFNDIHFSLAVMKVKTDKAPGLNGIRAELYKYSHWASARLSRLLQYTWESGKFPTDLVTGVATTCFKSGNAQLWKRYRIIVVFNVEFKIFAIMHSMRVISECKNFISD